MLNFFNNGECLLLTVHYSPSSVIIRAMDEKIYRIALDARFWRKDTAGIGRYTRELVHYLAKIDKTNQYTVILTNQDVPEWDVHQDNFKTAVVPFTHYSLSEQSRFLLWLNKQNFDLVHFLNFNHPVLYHKRFVVTIHDLTLFKFPADNKKRSMLRKLAFYAVFKHAAKYSNKVIAISKNTLEDTAKYFNVRINKFKLIYEGGPKIDESIKYNRESVTKYIESDCAYFLFVSQWRPHKGIITLVDAFNKFKAISKSNHKLVLLGNQKVATTQMLASINNSPYRSDIIIPGFAPDELLPSLYHFSTAFIVPSEYEGFGLPVLEAYSYQTPAIVAENSSLPEVAGKNALYFPTNNSDKLAEQMVRIIEDPSLAKILKSSGDEQLKLFSWQKCAQETYDTYIEVLKG